MKRLLLIFGLTASVLSCSGESTDAGDFDSMTDPTDVSTGASDGARDDGSSSSVLDANRGGDSAAIGPNPADIDSSNGSAESTTDSDLGLENGRPRWMEDGPDHFVSLTHLIDHNPSKRRYGIAITDFDRDGDFEAIVTGYGGANEVLDWRGGRVVNDDTTLIADDERRAIGVAACDVTGDGHEEIYFLNVDRFGGLGEVSDRLYVRTSEGWSDLFETESNRNAVNRFSGRSVACLDRFGDGRYGVFVANYGGPMKLFEVDDSGRMTDGAPNAGMNYATGGRSLMVLPGSTGLDVFAGNEGGANFFFRNQGDGTFVESAAELGLQDAAETVRGVAALDANDDGLLDLVYGNWEGPHRLFLQTPDGTYTDAAPEDMATPSRIRTVIAADFDNDGHEEIFWNNIGEPNRLFKRIEDEWTEISLGEAVEPDGLGTGAAVLDFDGDGRLELLVAHGEAGAQGLTMYQWGSHTHHYLRIQPLTRAGAPARGARVQIRQSTGRTHTRVIDSGSGYLCQMEPVAHFGLGDDAVVEDLHIEWPDGASLTVERPSTDQLLIIAHPEGDTVP